MQPMGSARPGPEADSQGDSCVTNIGPRERRKRMTFGIVSLVLSAGIAAAMLALGLERAWRLALFLPFASSGIGIFQALDKT